MNLLFVSLGIGFAICVALRLSLKKPFPVGLYLLTIVMWPIWLVMAACVGLYEGCVALMNAEI